MEEVKKGFFPLYLNFNDGINVDILRQFTRSKNYVNEFKDLVLFNQKHKEKNSYFKKLKKNISTTYNVGPKEKIISKFF